MFRNQIFLLLQAHVREIILLEQLHLHLVRKRVQEIIHLAPQHRAVHVPEVRDQELHVRKVDQVLHDQVLHVRKVDPVECQDHVLDLCVPVLQRAHNNDQMVHNVRKVAEDLAALRQLLDHIVRKLVQLVLVLPDKHDLVKVNQVEDSHRVDQEHVLELVAHLERMPARKRITRVRRLVVKKSTIWQRPHLVEQSFHAVMEILRFVYVVVHHLLTSQRKLVQIPQR